MKKTCVCIVVCTPLVLAGVILVKSLPHEQCKDTSILSDQAELLAFLLPEGFDIPVQAPAETADPFVFEVSAPPAPLPLAPPQLLVESAEERSVPAPIPPPSIVPQSFVVAMTDVETPPAPASEAPSSPATAASPSYIYFYTGIPVRPTPTTTSPIPVSPASTIFYTGGFASVTVVPTPVAKTHVVPIFTPQTVPSRVGAPKWVYSNGVVIKPKVYFPHQPFRNALRGVTP